MQDMKFLLNQLIDNWEDEVVEFKEASDSYSTKEIGKYFSALSNEANLRGKDNGWLVFGVHNKTRSITGTDYRDDKERLQSLKHQITQNADPPITMRNITELYCDGKRVLMFEIPPAPRGLFISWNGHPYARVGESLIPLTIDKQDEIRNQTLNYDWSSQVIKDADCSVLDEKAISVARNNFAIKHSNNFHESEVNSWSVETFLKRCRLLRDGSLTYSAILLLGKAESKTLLTPHPAQLTWKLAGSDAYQNFDPPFLITTTDLYKQIRNFQMRILPNDALLPVEVAKYDSKIVLEALHNCIAHQDYRRNGRIVVAEYEDRLVFENEGEFFEGKPEDYVLGEKTPRKYRNTLLAQAMVELNMIDTMGYGIHRMNSAQAKRYLPLPDYDLSEAKAVRLSIYSQVTDPSYSAMLIKITDLPLKDIWALDRIQKKLPLPKETIAILRKKKLIEGRIPNIHISSEIAEITDRKKSYMACLQIEDSFLIKQICVYITKFNEASRQDISSFMCDKLSSEMTKQQKEKKISNLLAKMKRNGIIEFEGTSPRQGKWKIVKKDL
ncbi:MAG: RNA-binding domain-containing protein [Phycisphaerae bacterium]